jgi:hypothetical protein
MFLFPPVVFSKEENLYVYTETRLLFDPEDGGIMHPEFASQ